MIILPETRIRLIDLVSNLHVNEDIHPVDYVGLSYVSQLLPNTSDYTALSMVVLTKELLDNQHKNSPFYTNNPEAASTIVKAKDILSQIISEFDARGILHVAPERNQ